MAVGAAVLVLQDANWLLRHLSLRWKYAREAAELQNFQSLQSVALLPSPAPNASFLEVLKNLDGPPPNPSERTVDRSSRTVRFGTGVVMEPVVFPDASDSVPSDVSTSLCSEPGLGIALPDSVSDQELSLPFHLRKLGRNPCIPVPGEHPVGSLDSIHLDGHTADYNSYHEKWRHAEAHHSGQNAVLVNSIGQRMAERCRMSLKIGHHSAHCNSMAILNITGGDEQAKLAKINPKAALDMMGLHHLEGQQLPIANVPDIPSVEDFRVKRKSLTPCHCAIRDLDAGSSGVPTEAEIEDTLQIGSTPSTKLPTTKDAIGVDLDLTPNSITRLPSRLDSSPLQPVKLVCMDNVLGPLDSVPPLDDSILGVLGSSGTCDAGVGASPRSSPRSPCLDLGIPSNGLPRVPFDSATFPAPSSEITGRSGVIDPQGNTLLPNGVNPVRPYSQPGAPIIPSGSPAPASPMGAADCSPRLLWSFVVKQNSPGVVWGIDLFDLRKVDFSLYCLGSIFGWVGISDDLFCCAALAGEELKSLNFLLPL
ncbi:hypothetical protein Nepgr_016452 [Nepenthes gracilis]|uniref:Uncharacterized protein n=1 Tax=Nepenthes gracilis TaxID=150966 RepID=A0AAD3XSB5_NEPGR|nr:hypothetical protein Nepgr_016452 [Nepenthes gracilis]